MEMEKLAVTQLSDRVVKNGKNRGKEPFSVFIKKYTFKHDRLNCLCGKCKDGPVLFILFCYDFPLQMKLHHTQI